MHACISVLCRSELLAQPLPYGTREPALEARWPQWGADCHCHVAIPSRRLEPSILLHSHHPATTQQRPPVCARLQVASSGLPRCWLLAVLLAHYAPFVPRRPLAAPTVCVGASMRNDIAPAQHALPQLTSPGRQPCLHALAAFPRGTCRCRCSPCARLPCQMHMLPAHPPRCRPPPPVWVGSGSETRVLLLIP